ncbi:MAG: thrombospondin type 3 repeat-containing protein, partial [Pseudomonadales bacterium]
DEDGVGDVADLDDDGDGVEDLSDAFPFDANEVADFDEDGVGDVADLDDDGDGVPDLDDPEPFNTLVSQLFPVFALEEQEAIEDGSEVGLLVTPEGLLVGVSATAPDRPSLFAGSRVSSALPAANRSARVEGSSDFLNGNSVPSREPLGGGLVAQVPGLSWQKLRGPITIFDRFEDDRSFRTLSEDLLLASGVPQNLTLFQDRLHLTFGRVRFDDAGAPQLLGDRAGAAEVLTQSLSFEELYGSAAIDLVTGEMTGALDLVLADPDASPEAAFPRYLTTFTAQLAQGELAAVDSTGAEYLLTDSSASVLDDGASVAVTLRFPALAEIAGFITGDSAEYLQLAFGFDTTAREGAGVQGLALLKSNAVTAAEQSALTTGHGFVGALCCDNQDITLLGGLASDPTAPPLLAVMVDAQGEPVSPGVAGFARFTPASEEQSLVLIRPASGDLVTALEFPVRPGTEGLIAQRWDRPMDEVAGSSIDVFLASSGALLPNAELTNTLFTLSGIPTGFSALQGTATYRDTDLIDAAFIGFPLPTEPGGIDPFAGFSVSFDIDFGSGLISQGHLGFGSDPAFETEILFSGQLFAAESGNSVALFVEQGILRGLEVDPQQSLLGGFFVGAEGEAFAGAFSLATNQPDGPVVSGLFVNSRFPLAPVFDGDQTAALFGSSELALTTTLAQEAQAPGLRFGLGFNGPDGPLVATATGPDPVAGILSARNAEVFPEGTVLLSGNLSGGFTEAAANPGGVEGLFWYRWPAPVRVFSDPRNSELFSDLDRALLVAIGTPTNLADLTATTEIFFNVPSALLFASTSETLVSLDGGVSLESSPSSASFGGGFGPALGAAQRFSVEAGADFSTQQVFGYGVLDLQQGAFQGGLELVLGSSQSPGESRYLGVYSAAVQNGAFGPSAFADAVYLPALENSNPSSLLFDTNVVGAQLSGQTIDLGAILDDLSIANAPAEGEVAGFFTGPDATALQLSFAFSSPQTSGPLAEGLALFQSPALTQEERTLLASQNVAFVGLSCCSDFGLGIGRAYEGDTPEAFLLTSVVRFGDDFFPQVGDPGFWYDPLATDVEAEVLRLFGGTAESISLPASLSSEVSGVRWLSTAADGPSVGVIEADNGALVELIDDVLFLTAMPTIQFPSFTTVRTFRADLIFDGFASDIFSTSPGALSLANTPLDLSFNVDLASGAIPFGRLAFALPNSGGFVEGRFSGQVRFDTDYQYLDVGFSDGFFGAAPLDLLESEIQGFFSGPSAEQFVGGFSLQANPFTNAVSPSNSSTAPLNLAEGLFVAEQGPREGGGALSEQDRLALADSTEIFLALDTSLSGSQSPGQRLGRLVDQTEAVGDIPEFLLGSHPQGLSETFTEPLGSDTEVVRIADRPATKIELGAGANAAAFL